MDGNPITELEYHMIADYSNSKAAKDINYTLAANLELCERYMNLKGVGRDSKKVEALMVKFLFVYWCIAESQNSFQANWKAV